MYQNMLMMEAAVTRMSSSLALKYGMARIRICGRGRCLRLALTFAGPLPVTGNRLMLARVDSSTTKL